MRAFLLNLSALAKEAAEQIEATGETAIEEAAPAKEPTKAKPKAKPKPKVKKDAPVEEVEEGTEDTTQDEETSEAVAKERIMPSAKFMASRVQKLIAGGFLAAPDVREALQTVDAANLMAVADEDLDVLWVAFADAWEAYKESKGA